MCVCTHIHNLFQLVTFGSCDEFVVIRVTILFYSTFLTLVHTLNNSFALFLFIFYMYLAAVESVVWNGG